MNNNNLIKTIIVIFYKELNKTIKTVHKVLKLFPFETENCKDF